MIDKLPKPVKSKAMTMYERLLKKGEEIGIRKGEAIGKRKGEEIGVKLTLKVLKLHKSNVEPKTIARDLSIPIEFVLKVIQGFEGL